MKKRILILAFSPLIAAVFICLFLADCLIETILRGGKWIATGIDEATERQWIIEKFAKILH